MEENTRIMYEQTCRTKSLTHKNNPQWSRQLSQPTLLRASEARLMGVSSKGGKCAESPPTFICGKRRKNRRKPVMKNIPDSGVVFTFEEGRQKRGSCSYVPSIEEEIRPT
ncbi:hypothetical protein HKD37_U058993 [Glycine soja]